MRKRIAAASALAVLAAVFAVRAQSPAPIEVTAEDLADAGYTQVEELDPDGARFAPPVRYFRVGETLSETDAKRDCGDCADLVAAFVGRDMSEPAWVRESAEPLRIVGGRIQSRRYLPSAKTVIVVTGPDIGKVAALSDILYARASGN